jgi:hypothetical protein
MVRKAKILGKNGRARNASMVEEILAGGAGLAEDADVWKPAEQRVEYLANGSGSNP